MDSLSEKTCSACRADSPLISESDLQEALRKLPDWRAVVISGEQQLTRGYRFKNFAQALEFTQAVGQLAEAHNHHPALLTEWGSVEVRWWTHKIHGLHENDVIMAAKTEQLFHAHFERQP